MRVRRYLFLMGLVALAAALAVTTPWARDEPVHRGQGRVVVIDEDGDRHENVWVFGDDVGWLGVSLDRSRDPRGARIEDVADDSPAERAGLRDGDVIVAVDGEQVDGPSDVSRRIRSLEPGDQVELEILRDGGRQRLVAELDEAPRAFSFSGSGEFDFDFDFDDEALREHLREMEERLSEMDFDVRIPEIDLHGPLHGFAFGIGGFHRPMLGVQTVQPTPELREFVGGPRDAGVLIGKVLEDTPAEEAGLQVGDLIVAVDGEEIEDSGDLIRALRGRDGETVGVELVRDGRTFTVDVALPDRDEEDDDRDRPSRRIRRLAAPGPATEKA